jgi:hypothetical protein
VSALPSHLELLEADVSSAAARRVRQLRVRRRLTYAVALTAALLIMAGAGLAASGAGIFGWLAAGGSGEARFAIDASRVYDGPAPQLLACTDTSGETFSCAPGSGTARVYELLMRTEAPQVLTREQALARIEALVRSGEIDQGQAQQTTADLRAVPDDFFAKLSILSSLSSVGVGAGVSRGNEVRELVPPPGAPRIVECEQRDPASFTCRPLAGASDVPVGAPIYSLRQSSDWQERVPQPGSDGAGDVRALIDAVWGRPLEPAELRLLHLVSETATTSSSSSDATTAEAP